MKCPTQGATVVSFAPYVSLVTIGCTIPVIEVPEGLPCPALEEMAFALAQFGHMVIDRPLPTNTIERLGDETKTIPNIYRKGKEAFAFCARKLSQ